MNPPASDLCLNPSPACDRAAVSDWHRLLGALLAVRALLCAACCALLGHRYVTTHNHLITGEPIYRVRVCNRCHRRHVEIVRQ